MQKQNYALTAYQSFNALKGAIQDKAGTILTLMVGVMAFSLVMPELAMAADPALPGTGVGTKSADLAGDTSKFMKTYSNYFIGLIGIITFLVAAGWILTATGSWVDGRPDGSIGKLMGVFIVAILVSIFVMFLLGQALALSTSTFGAAT